jgi:hypothetical protein
MSSQPSYFIQRSIPSLTVLMLVTTACGSSGGSDKDGADQGGAGNGSGGAPAGTEGTPAASGGTGGRASGTGGTMSAGQHTGTGGSKAGGTGTADGGDSTGTGGTIADAGMTDASTNPGDAGASTHKPKCETFPDDLTSAAGEMWRMYAVGGCSLGSGGLCLIPDQLDQAIMDDPNIIAGVMTGGGNDILIADEDMFPGSTECKDRTDADMVQVCQDVVATAMAAGEKLMDHAAAAGIRDVIYLFYPHIPGGGFGGENPNVLLDYSLPMARELCETAEDRTGGKLRCHFIDLVPIFEGHSDWFADDGIHENELGSAAMAKEVVRVAKENCIAQPASSGCCEP